MDFIILNSNPLQVATWGPVSGQAPSLGQIKNSLCLVLLQVWKEVQVLGLFVKTEL